jgi:hypothetical protein
MAGVPASVTKIGKLMPVVPGALIAMAPVKGPGVAGSAVGFTVTWRPPARVPDCGFTVSQPPPSLVRGVAVNVVTLELLLESVTDCVAGTVLFTENRKLSELGLAEIELVPGNVLSSARTERDAPVAFMLMKPSSVDKLESAGFTDTVSCSGVVPLVGETVSQLLVETVDTETLTDPLEDVIIMVCGEMVPFCALKLSWGGLAVRVPLWASAVSEIHTKASSKLPRQTRDF